MSKKRKMSNLIERISWDIEEVNIVLEIITLGKIDTFIEAQALASLALVKSKRIDKSNDKIERILANFGKPKNNIKS